MSVSLWDRQARREHSGTGNISEPGTYRPSGGCSALVQLAVRICIIKLYMRVLLPVKCPLSLCTEASPHSPRLDRVQPPLKGRFACEAASALDKHWLAQLKPQRMHPHTCEPSVVCVVGKETCSHQCRSPMFEIYHFSIEGYDKCAKVTLSILFRNHCVRSPTRWQ